MRSDRVGCIAAGVTLIIKNMNYYIWTIGCQMNVADSRNLADGLEKLGYTEVSKPEDARKEPPETSLMMRSWRDIESTLDRGTGE